MSAIGPDLCSILLLLLLLRACARVPPDIPVDAFNWLDRMMNYNVPGGKMNRGLSVHDTYAALVGRPLTEDEVTKAFVLGWTVEWLQAFFLVADDIMDRSITRRGQPCWYKVRKNVSAPSPGHFLSLALALSMPSAPFFSLPRAPADACSNGSDRKNNTPSRRTPRSATSPSMTPSPWSRPSTSC